MKATLIIQNIENLYTCDENFTVISHGFVAIHHDRIIDYGNHSYKKWLDPATAVIDARGETVIPALIDCNYGGFQHVRLGDQLRHDGAALFAMRSNGILTLLTKKAALQRRELTQDVLVAKKNSDVPILDTNGFRLQDIPDRFMLSCSFGKPNSYIYSFQPLTYFLFNTYKVEGRRILESMTSLPAKEFGFKDRGSIQIGNRADLLILQVPTIEHYFQTMGRPLIHRMIKNGIQFYPHWLVC